MLVKAASDAIELVQDLDAVFGRDVVRWRLAEVRAAMVAGEIRGLVRFRHLARLTRHLFERGDAVLGVGVRREQLSMPSPGQRVDDEHVRGGRRRFRRSRWGCAARSSGSWPAPRRATADGRRSCAPMRSAGYSRERLIAICTSMAASGATMIADERADPADAAAVVAIAAEQRRRTACTARASRWRRRWWRRPSWSACRGS